MIRSFTLFVIALLTIICSVQAQYSLDPTLIPPQTDSMPSWAKLLYKKPVNVIELEKAYKEYYQTHIFEKNAYTRLYKRWRAASLPFIGADGIVRPPSNAQEMNIWRSSREQVSKSKKSSISSTLWQPFDMETRWLKSDASAQTVCPWQANIYGFDISRSNPDILVVGTEPGGIFRTTNKGKSWEQIGSNYLLGTEAISIHPTDPATFILGTDNAIRKTIDGGITWTTIFQKSDMWVHDIEISYANPNLYFAGTTQGLFRSTDAGATWKQILTDVITDLEILNNTPNEIVVLKQNKTSNFYELWKSIDEGATFTARTNGWVTGLTGGEGRLGITTADAKRIYVLMLSNKEPRVLRSDDGGENWSLTASGKTDKLNVNNGQGYYDMSVVVSQTNPNDVIVATTTAYKSTDGGVTFSELGGYAGPFPIHPDIQEMKAIGNDTWIATDGGITYSTDFFTDTKNADARIKGIFGSDFWGFDQGWNEDVVVGGRYHNGNTARHENYQGTFLRMGGAESATGYINPADARTCYFSDIGGYRVPSTSDGKVTSIAMSKYPNESYYLMEYSDMVWDPRYSNTLWLGNGATLWKSENGGAKFDSIFVTTDKDAVIEHIEISRSNPNVMYVTQRSNTLYDGKIWRTEDGGKTWATCSNPENTSGAERRVSQITVSGTNENELWVAYRTGSAANKVFKTTDGGKSWQNLTTPTIGKSTSSDIIHQMGTEGGVYLACDGGKVFYRNISMTDWQPYSEGLPVALTIRGIKCFYRDGRLRIGTSMGVWDAPLFEQSNPLAQPMADRSVSQCSRDTIQFIDYSVMNKAGASYSWKFPGSRYVNSDTIPNPRVVYDKPGIYAATLTVNNINGISNSKLVDNFINVLPSVCEAEWMPGQALSLSKNNDLGRIDSIPALAGATTFTVSMWVKLDTIQQSFSQILSNWNSNIGFSFGFSFQGYRPNTNLTFYWRDVPYQLTSPFDLSINQWTHIAITIEPTKATLYRDGEKWERAGNYAGFDLSHTPFEIGGGLPGQGGNFRGEIEELKVYNRALSQNEIREQMHLIRGEKVGEAPIAYYQFNEIQENTIFDRSLGTAHASNGGGNHIVSTAPIGRGTSSRSETIEGKMSFPATGISMFLKPTLATEIATYRFSTIPDSMPVSTDLGLSWWMIRGWNDKGSPVNSIGIDSIQFSRVGKITESDANNPSVFTMYKRSNTSHTNSWKIAAAGQSTEPLLDAISFGSDTASAGQYLLESKGTTVLGVDESKQSIVISLVPNPATGMLSLFIDDTIVGTNTKVEITNLLGQVMKVISIQPNHTMIDISDLPSGLYALRIGNSSAVFVKL
ncbi:MAG: T9SS type A sorting domain-containing protein [Ignavibacteriae bacterium]|nr:T9SS type A sorting domain-containing protein [Ignavibacteriota bacterium]